MIDELFLLLGSRPSIVLVMLPRIPLVPQKLRVHPLGGAVAMLAGLLDPVSVGLVGLVVGSVILRLRHPEESERTMLRTPVRQWRLGLGAALSLPTSG